MKLGELIWELGFNADTMKLKDFGRAVSDLNVSSIITAGSFGALYESAKALIDITTTTAQGINKFGRETGQSRQEIQKWTTLAAQMGVSAETVAGSVGTLEDSIFKMRFTGEGSNIWALLGIDPRNTRNVFEVLRMLHDRLHGMNIEAQRFFTQQLGLPTEMVNLWSLTNDQFEKALKAQTNSNEELDKANKLYQEQQKLAQDLKKTWIDLGVSLIPLADALIRMADSMNNIVRNSKEFQNFIGEIAKSLKGLGDLLELSGKGWKKIFDYVSVVAKYLTPGQNIAFNPALGSLATAQAFIPQALNPNTGILNSKSNPNVTVKMRNVIQTTDPNTKVTTFQEQWDKALNDAVNDRPEGSY